MGKLKIALEYLVAIAILVIVVLFDRTTVFAATPTLTISATNLPPVDLMPSSPDTTSQTISVTTNNYTGYNITLVTSGNSTDLVNTTNPSLLIPTITLPSGTSSKVLNDFSNEYGFSTDGINFRPAPNPTGNGVLLDTVASAGTNSTVLTFGVEVEDNFPAGTYERTYQIVAMVNEPQYSLTYNANTTDTVSNLPSNISTTTSSTGTVNISSTAPTRNGYTFLGWDTDSSVTSNPTYSAGDTITLDPTQANAITLYAIWEPGIYINGVSTKNMTQSQAAAYYGQTVATVAGSAFNPNSGDTRTWRVFYIDTANKYGDGKGTIYLKADNNSNRTIRFNTVNSATDTGGYESVFAANNIVRSINGSTTNYTVSANRYYRITNGNVVNSSGTVINTKYLKLNPTYATGRVSYSNTYTSSATFFNMEKAAAYLCDPSRFSDYSDSRTNYAIGSPSLEMYIDSWNAKHPSNTMNYRFNVNADGTTNSQKLPGYQLYPSSTDGWGTATPNVDINALDTIGMYKTSSGLWLASPSIIYKGGSLIRVSNSSTIGIGNATINMFYEFSPVVSVAVAAYVFTTSY